MSPGVSAFLLDLYRVSRRLPHSEFRQWVFDELGSLVQLDSGFWYRAAISYENSENSSIHAWYLYRQPERLIQEYAAGMLWQEDVVYHKALAAPPGTAVHASYQHYSSERMRAFLKRYRQEHVMTIGIFQEVPQIVAGFSLYRNETRCSFSDEDVSNIETVAPHVIDAWRENWLNEAIRKASSRPAPVEFCLAVTMPDQILSEAQDNFGHLMHLEWPGWQGPRLPKELQSWLMSLNPSPWTGKAISVYRRKQPDETTLLLLRRSHPWDRLAPRKRMVALLFAEGASQTQVAERAHLSPSTVNNYLGSIYKELDLTDKTALSRLVERLHP
ncbi:response regulator transcription factor [Paraburkholderia sp. MM5477-R1]|uniref:response regulator transcription factor n=1 Tax=Paraburkholderia sp. MM5477-R1 TaxID=2991062 RepID=UPI003D1B64AB